MKTVAEMRGKGAQQQSAAGAQPQPAADDETVGMGEPATEQEQEAYSRVVLGASKIIYDKGSHPKIMEMLKAQADVPEEAIGDTAAFLVKTLDDQANGSIPEVAILPPVAEIVHELGRVADAAQLFPVDEAMLNRAAAIAVDDLAEAYDVTPEDLEEFMASIPPEQVEAMRAQFEGYGVPQRMAQGQPGAEGGQPPPGAAPPQPGGMPGG